MATRQSVRTAGNARNTTHANQNMRPCPAYRLALSRYTRIRTKLRTRVSSFTKQTTHASYSGVSEFKSECGDWLSWPRNLLRSSAVPLPKMLGWYLRLRHIRFLSLKPRIYLACLHSEDGVSTFLHRVGTYQYAYCLASISQKTTDVMC